MKTSDIDSDLLPPLPDAMTREEFSARLHELHLILRGRPRARRIVRGLVPNVDVQVGPHRMHLHPRDNYTDYRLWADRVSPENDSVTQLEERIRDRKALVLDIGANCGSFTLRLIGAAGPGSKVHAFEPNPVMFERLLKNLKLNKMENAVELHQIALGPETGTAVLTLKPGNFGQATLRETAADYETVSVPVEMLETFFSGASEFERTVVKIDVEGYEDAVFAGFFERLDTANWPDDILIETQHKRVWKTDLCAVFEAHGYQAVFKGDGNTLYSRETA